MTPPFEISRNLNAVQVHHYIHWLGHSGFSNANQQITYDPQSYLNIDELFRLLHFLEPISEGRTWEFWLCARRGTIQDFAATHGSYEENLQDGTVDSYKEYEEYWHTEFPNEIEWYRLTAVEDHSIQYRAIFLNNRQVLETDGRREKGQFPHDISGFTAWLTDSVGLVIKAVKAGLYNDAISKLLPYKHRVGVISRAALWEIYPEDREEYFKDLTQKEVDEFLTSATEDPTSLGTKLEQMTANDFYRFCSAGYRANKYDTDGLTPREQYDKYADGRDEGLKEIDPNSPAAFAAWYDGPRWGGHPWEVCRGGNSTHVSLYVAGNPQEGYYLIVAGSALWRSAETIKFFLALRKLQVPVLIRDAELLKKRLLGEELVGIVPVGVFPRYCSSWFPNEDINSFINLSYEKAEEEVRRAEWLPLQKIKLRKQEGQNETQRIPSH